MKIIANIKPAPIPADWPQPPATPEYEKLAQWIATNPKRINEQPLYEIAGIDTSKLAKESEAMSEYSQRIHCLAHGIAPRSLTEPFVGDGTSE